MMGKEKEDERKERKRHTKKKSRWLGRHARPAGIYKTTGEVTGDGAPCLADGANLKHPSETAAAYHAARRGVQNPSRYACPPHTTDRNLPPWPVVKSVCRLPMTSLPITARSCPFQNLPRPIQGLADPVRSALPSNVDACYSRLILEPHRQILTLTLTLTLAAVTWRLAARRLVALLPDHTVTGWQGWPAGWLTSDHKPAQPAQPPRQSPGPTNTVPVCRRLPRPTSIAALRQLVMACRPPLSPWGPGLSAVPNLIDPPLPVDL